MQDKICSLILFLDVMSFEKCVNNIVCNVTENETYHFILFTEVMRKETYCLILLANVMKIKTYHLILCA
jgi:hypothetical protein